MDVLMWYKYELFVSIIVWCSEHSGHHLNFSSRLKYWQINARCMRYHGNTTNLGKHFGLIHSAECDEVV